MVCCDYFDRYNKLHFLVFCVRPLQRPNTARNLKYFGGVHSRFPSFARQLSFLIVKSKQYIYLSVKRLAEVSLMLASATLSYPYFLRSICHYLPKCHLCLSLLYASKTTPRLIASLGVVGHDCLMRKRILECTRASVKCSLLICL